MKKILPLTVLPLALASCSLFGVPNGDVSGSISNAPSGSIRMAVLGITFAGQTNTTVNQIAVTPGADGKYIISLPSTPANGGYEVIAYQDTSGDGNYQSGEPRTKNNGKTLVYSNTAVTIGSFNLPQGWSQWEGTTLTKTGTPFTGYDVSF